MEIATYTISRTGTIVHDHSEGIVRSIDGASSKWTNYVYQFVYVGKANILPRRYSYSINPTFAQCRLSSATFWSIANMLEHISQISIPTLTLQYSFSNRWSFPA